MVDLKIPGLDLSKRRSEVLGNGDKERGVFFEEARQDGLARWSLLPRTWETHCDNVFVSVAGHPFTDRAVC